MKKGIQVMAAIVLLSCGLVPADAALLFQENFDGTPGQDISDASRPDPWTRHDQFPATQISSSSIDSGYCATNLVPSSYVWSQYWRPMTDYHLQNGETLELTWVGKLTGGDGYQGVQLVGDDLTQVYGFGAQLYQGLRQFNTQSGSINVNVAMDGSVGETLDMRVLLTKSTTDFYYRNHGDTPWQLIRSASTGTGDAGLNRVFFALARYESGSGQWADSIQVTSTVPEPSSLLAGAALLAPLLAFRRRRS